MGKMKKIKKRIKKLIFNKTVRNILIILIIYNAFIYTSFYISAIKNNRIKKIFNVPQIKHPQPDDIILVIAPHPDDETLGPGGYIKKAIKNGATIYVIVMTYGDGYKIAAETEQRFDGSAKSMIKFGKKRRLETIEALGSLGVKEQNIYFLGFPDRGISPMWINYWETSYKSYFTKTDRSPYDTSYIPKISYKGKEVFYSLYTLIKKIKPNIIFLPSPFDFHVDHWSTYSFSISAILQLLKEKEIGIPTIYTYLVHYRNFPYPKGYYPKGALLPPKDMKIYKTRWRSYDIEDVEMEKKKAILKYKTQLVLLKRLLLSFVRTNELWGEVPEVPLSPDTQYRLPDLLTDVLIDYIDSSANIKDIEMINYNKTLYMYINVMRKISKKYIYHLRFFIPQKDGAIKGIISYNKKRGMNIFISRNKGWNPDRNNIKAMAQKNSVEFVLPLPQNTKQILVGYDTNLAKKTRLPYIDTTGEFIINLR